MEHLAINWKLIHSFLIGAQDVDSFLDLSSDFLITTDIDIRTLYWKKGKNDYAENQEKTFFHLVMHQLSYSSVRINESKVLN